MQFHIRPYHSSDLPALYRICVQTSNYGDDASADYSDPDILGHIYAGPYGIYEPGMCFTLTANGAPAGYMLGARDTLAFNERLEAEWFPVLRNRYPMPPIEDESPQAGTIRTIHRGLYCDPQVAADYPAHLHIDLLPVARSRGLGRSLMNTFLANLRDLKISGVHLGVGAGNERGIAFYRRCGFQELQVHQWGILFGMRL